MLLAGDIGGTKTNLAVFSSEGGLRSPLIERTFPSQEYPSLEAVGSEFLADIESQGIKTGELDRAVFGVAGPVVRGKATITNLPWVMNETQLADALDLSSVILLNDLAAIAQSVPHLEASDLQALKEGEPVEGGAIAVIAPGTGLGEGYLTWDGAHYRAFASEGGHTDFGPATLQQIDMLRFLKKKFEHVSYERVCSGKGLPNIYAFLKDSGHAEETPALAEQIATTKDPTPIIVQAALDKESELCVETLEMFVSILGSEAGNLTLKVMASGGVYLGGGIPPRILSALKEGPFMEAFLRKGRFAEFLKQVPVQVILNPKSALLGAAWYGFEL